MIHRGAALESMGQHEEALQAFETAVSIDPQFHPAHSAKTTVLIALNRFDQAVAASTSAIELNGSDSKAFADRAFCHLKLKQYADAIQDFNTAKSLGDSTSETVRLYSMALRFHAEELNKSGNATAAVDLYDAALAESSDGQTNEDILFNKLRFLFSSSSHFLAFTLNLLEVYECIYYLFVALNFFKKVFFFFFLNI